MKVLEEFVVKGRGFYVVLFELEEFYLLYEEEVKYVELVFEGIEKLFERMVEIENEVDEYVLLKF